MSVSWQLSAQIALAGSILERVHGQTLKFLPVLVLTNLPQRSLVASREVPVFVTEASDYDCLTENQWYRADRVSVQTKRSGLHLSIN